MDKQQFKYFAFISYSGKDEKWAKWLHSHLEHYHIPAALCKEHPDIPKKIRPVFWYKKDLSGTKLKEALEQELDLSKYLIVICSPDAAKSEWVNDEVKSFIAKGKSKYIIPFIVSGIPHSADETEECFPESLRSLPREEEIRGISVQADGKQHALVDVVATMFGVSFDTLWQRHKRRARNIRNIWLSICALMVICAAGVWDYTRTKVEYYADWVDCNGIAQGIIPLDDEQVNHRHYSYKFESSRVPFGEKGFYSWRLKRVSIVNSKGVISNYRPDNHDFFHPIQEYKYTDGYVTEIINRDNYNRVVMRYSIRDDYNNHSACLYDFAGKDVRQESSYLNASTTAMNVGNISDNKSKIKRLHYTRNEQGYITRVTYHANDDDDLKESAIGDNNNIYGKIFELDSLGRIIKTSYISNDGVLMTDKFGVGHIKFSYSSFCGEETVEYLGSDEKLANNEQKYARIISKLDKFGNPVEQWYEGADGEPCFNDKNIHRQIMTFDENGFLVEMKFFDFDGNLAYCSDNYAIQRGKYDEKGRTIESSHFDINDKPCYTKDNYSISKMKYNSNNCMVDISLYDIDGNPCINKEEMVHCVKVNYDEYNYPIDYTYFNTDGELSISPSYGYAKQTNLYDDYHQLISSKVYDENDCPCICPSNYTCESRYYYDSRGNLIKIEYFDNQGNPCISKYGYAIVNYEYDNYGNKINESYYGIDHNPVYVNMVASIQIDYYPNGKIKETRYYDENKKLCLNKDWYAICKYTYNNNGDQIKVSYFDTDTLPCLIKDGLYSVMTSEYDANGNVIIETHFGTNGKMCLIDKGYAIGKYKYNAYRQIVEYSYFDINENPCYYNREFSKTRRYYNKRGEIIKDEYFDTNDKLCVNKTGAAATKYYYDDKGRILKCSTYDTNGILTNNSEDYCMTNYRYNAKGQLEELYYLDKNQKPCLRNVTNEMLWYSKKAYKYDQKGNCIEYSYYDENDNPVKIQDFAILYTTYDEYNRVTEQKWKKANGNLGIGGHHHMGIIRYEYNKKNNCISDVLLFGTDSILQAHIMYYVDKRGRIYKTEIRDRHSRLKSTYIYGFTDTKYAIMVDSINEFGQNIKRQYYGEDGKLGNTEDGVAVLLNTYDRFGRLISQELFDEHEKATHSTIFAFYKRKIEYNSRGFISEESFFDENGSFVNSSVINGMCQQKLFYDEKGTLDPEKSIYYTSVNGRAIDVNEYNKFFKEEARRTEGTLVWCNVEFPGLFKEKGLLGQYCILEWNEWNIYSNIEAFAQTFNASLPNEKRLLLVPLTANGLGKIIEITFPAGSLGIRIMDSDSNHIFNDLVEIYEAYKNQ